MNSFCLELKTTCNSCGNPLPLNAFVEEFTCPACNSINKIDNDTWKSLLDEATKDARSFAPGEGRNSQIMGGGGSFNIMYGSQNPRCSKCKTPIPLDNLDTLSQSPHYKCTKCENIIYVREGSGLKGSFSSFKYFIGEDESLINKGADSSAISENEENKPKPVLFTCPSCGGNLKIDGSERTITCSFCDSSIYLPDDLWHRMHPVKTVSRWYILIDDSSLPLSWDELNDAVMDENGTIFYCGVDSDDDNFMLASSDSSLKKKWVRFDLKIENSGTFLSYGNGKLILWSKDYQPVYNLSVKDGSIVEIIPDKPKVENSLTMNRPDSLTLCHDGTVIALKEDKILRLDLNNNPLPVWPEKPSHGFLSKIFGGGDEDDSPDVNELKDYPEHIESCASLINTGWDGSIYFLKNYSECFLAKYDSSGKKVYCVPLDFEECTGKPHADSAGNAYVFGKDKSEKYNIVKISADGNDVKIIISGITSKEDSDFDTMIVSKNGEVYVFGDDSCFKAYDSSYKLKG